MRVALFLMLATVVFASDIKWMTLADAKIAAKRDNKIIMVEVSAHGCKYCVDMANTTLKNQAIVDKINRYFAPVLYYSNSDEIPKEFLAKGTPTFFFVDKNGKKLFPPIFGAWNVTDFDFFLESAIKKNRER